MKQDVYTMVVAMLVCTKALAQSPYIDKVYEFCPAPGQFVNLLPEYEEGDTEETMRQKANDCLANDAQEMVSLGGFGGYVVFGFDHMVENKKGMMDFSILGNAFYANANPNADAPVEGGSCEPGIVMVSHDTNGNGEPDDEWFELAGSEYVKPVTTHNYSITYYRPNECKAHTPDGSNPALIDTTYIAWRDNQGKCGYVSRNIYHKQPYFPQWSELDELSFIGTRLANNGVDESGQGNYYVLYCYGYGYVDNHPNNDWRSCFNIEWAVDADGNHIKLPGINFVKVYSGLNQYCGWLGETSTEVMGAYDLHLLHNRIEDVTGIKRIDTDLNEDEQIYYSLNGVRVDNPQKGQVYIMKKDRDYNRVLYR